MARHDSGTAYKSTTVQSVSADGLTIMVPDSIDLDAGDIGRRIVNVSQGGNINQRGTHRTIASVDNTAGSKSITFTEPWGVSAFRGLTNIITGNRFTEEVPSVGHALRMSWDLFRIANGDETPPLSAFSGSPVAPQAGELFTVVDAATRHIRLNENSLDGTPLFWITHSNIVFHFDNGTFEYHNQRNPASRRGLSPRQDSYFIFGDVNFGDTTNPDLNGFPFNTVIVRDTSESSSTEDDQNSSGHWIQHGGEYHAQAGCFLRVYGGELNAYRGETRWFRFIDVDAYGSFGGRFDGTNSIWLAGSASGNEIENPGSTTTSATRNNIGFGNPIRPGLVQDVALRDAQQGIYNIFRIAGTTTIPAVSIQDIGGVTGARVIRGNHESGSPNGNQDHSLTLLNWSIDELIRESSQTGTQLYHVDGVNTARNHRLFIDKVVDFNLVDENSDALTAATRVVRRDNVSDAVTLNNVTDGSLSARLRAYEFDIENTVDDFDDPDAINRTPYTIVIKARNRNLITTRETLRGPIGPLARNFAVLPDINITETNENVVAGYTELENTDKLYDWADLYKFFDLGRATPDFPIDENLFTKSGAILTTNYNVTLGNHSDTSRITFSSETIFPDVGNGTMVFTGGFTINNVPDGMGGTTIRRLNLGNYQITDNISAHFIENPRAYPTVPEDRSVSNSFGGTVTGTINLNPAMGTTINLVFGTTTGHSLTINNQGDGNVVLYGLTAGDLTDMSNAATTVDSDRTGITVTGNVTAEEAPSPPMAQPTEAMIVFGEDFNDDAIFEIVQAPDTGFDILVTGATPPQVAVNRSYSLNTLLGGLDTDEAANAGTGYNGIRNRFRLTVSYIDHEPTSWTFVIDRNTLDTTSDQLVYTITPVGIVNQRENRAMARTSTAFPGRSMVMQFNGDPNNLVDRFEIDGCQDVVATHASGNPLRRKNPANPLQTVEMFAADRVNAARMRRARARGHAGYDSDNDATVNAAANNLTNAVRWDFGLPINEGSELLVRDIDEVIFVDADDDLGTQRLTNVQRTINTPEDFTAITDFSQGGPFDIGTDYLLSGEPEVESIDQTDATGARQAQLLATTATREILDDRGLTAQNMRNIAVFGGVYIDEDNNRFFGPDLTDQSGGDS